MRIYATIRASLFIFTLLIFAAQPAAAEVFDVSTAEELQQALDDAEINGQDDTINLAAGTYSTADNMDMPFKYTATQSNSLSIVGAGSTVLDGADTSQILKIEDFGTTVGQVNVSGITFQNGQTGGDAGAGMNINVKGTTEIDVTVEHCEFIGNDNTVASGGGLAIFTHEGISLNHNTFRMNTTTTGSGAGAFLDANNGVSLNANIFIENTANGGSGGGATILDDTGPIVLTNNTFYMNSTTEAGGGLFVETKDGLTNITNNTLFDNHADTSGGGIQIDLDDIGTTGNLFNNIIYDNTTQGLGADINSDSDPLAKINIFNNDFSQFNDVNGSLVTLGSNKDIDPELIDPAGGDFRLMPLSPVIDNGSDPAPSLPAEDQVGNPRVVGPAPDMGALEALPLLTVDPTAMDFGTLNTSQSATQTLTLSNTGNKTLNVTGFGLSGDGNFSVDPDGGANPCGTTTPTILSGESCTMSVSFNLFSGSGSNLTATITITSDDPLNPQIIIQLTGNGPDGGGGCHLSSSPGASAGWWLVLLPVLWALKRRFRFGR